MRVRAIDKLQVLDSWESYHSLEPDCANFVYYEIR
jgi:hypothetical protein